MRVLFARLTFAFGIGVPGCFVWMGVFAMVAGGWGVLLGPAIIVPGLVGLGIGWGVAMLVAPSSSLDDGMLASVLCLFAIGPLVFVFAPVAMVLARPFDSQWSWLGLVGPVVLVLFFISSALIPAEVD